MKTCKGCGWTDKEGKEWWWDTPDICCKSCWFKWVRDIKKKFQLKLKGWQSTKGILK